MSPDHRERRTELLEALKDVRVQFWACPNEDHKRVTWTGDVAACDSCGMTSEMTARLIRAAVAYERERIMALFRRAATGRREYAKQAAEGSEGRAILLKTAEYYDSLVYLIKDPLQIMDIVPSWMWTDEENASLHVRKVVITACAPPGCGDGCDCNG